MANIGKWNTPSAVVTVLSTELNALGIGAMSAASTAIANQTNLDMFCDLEVNLAALSPTAGARIDIYILESVDGTNYPAQSAADLRLTVSQLLASIPIGTTAATAQRVVARIPSLPPASFKLVADNQAGVALGATGNTIKILTYNTNLNG